MTAWRVRRRAAVALVACASALLARAPHAEPAPRAEPVRREELEFVRRQRRPLTESPSQAWTSAWLAGARVVGLGEQTHGARDGVVTRFELAKALILEHGFDVMAIEAGYEASWALAEWIRGGAGAPEPAIDRLGTWIWHSGEMLEFATWLRAENARRGPNRAIELVGVYGYTYYPNKLETLRAHLVASRADSRLVAEVPSVERCVDLDPRFASSEPWAQAKQRDPILAVLLDSLDNCDIGPGLQAQADRFAATLAMRLLGMAESRAGRPRRMVLLAHNGHVAKARIGHLQEDALGQHLARALGDGYRAVGVTIGEGRFNGAYKHPKTGYAPNHSTLTLDRIQPGSLESVLSTGGPRFFLPTRVSAAAWPGPARPMRDIGAGYSPPYAWYFWSPVQLQDAFDAIVFVSTTEPIVERPWGKQR